MTAGALRAALLALAMLAGGACRTQPYTDDAGTNQLADLSGHQDLAGKPVDLAGADLAHTCGPNCKSCPSEVCCGSGCCQPGEWCGPDGQCHCGNGPGCASPQFCASGGPAGPPMTCGAICCGGGTPCPL